MHKSWELWIAQCSRAKRGVSEWAGQQSLIELIDIDMEAAPVDLVFSTEIFLNFLEQRNLDRGTYHPGNYTSIELIDIDRGAAGSWSQPCYHLTAFVVWADVEVLGFLCFRWIDNSWLLSRRLFFQLNWISRTLRRCPPKHMYKIGVRGNPTDL